MVLFIIYRITKKRSKRVTHTHTQVEMKVLKRGNVTFTSRIIRCREETRAWLWIYCTCECVAGCLCACEAVRKYKTESFKVATRSEKNNYKTGAVWLQFCTVPEPETGMQSLFFLNAITLPIEMQEDNRCSL